MTILANTPDHLVEYDAGMLIIHRRSDEKYMALRGRGIAGQFRDCIKTHGAERTIATYTRIAGPNPTWHEPMYKKGRMPEYRA